MKPPVKLFWVEVTNGKAGHNKRGGGKLSSRKAAEDRAEWLRANGAECVIHESEPIHWKVAS